MKKATKKPVEDLSIKKRFVKWVASGYRTIEIEEPAKEKRLPSGKVIILSEAKVTKKVDFRVPVRSGIVLDSQEKTGKVFRQYPDLALCNHVDMKFYPIGG